MGQARRKVLVIDDDASVCAFVSKSLTGRGVDVFTSSDPQEGVRLADAENPDLLFISLLLSNSNGLKVSKAVHAIDHLRKVPVVMLISYAGELDAKYTASIGIIDVFVKPLNETDFVSRTLALLDRYAPPAKESGTQDDELPGAPDEDGSGLEEDEKGGVFGLALDEGPRDALSMQEHEQDIEPDNHSVEKGEEMGYEFDELDDQEEGKKPDFGLPEDIEPDHYAQMPEKKSSSKKILVIVVACIMLAGIVIGAYFAKRYFSGSGQQAKPATAEAPAAPVAPAAEKPAPPVETAAKEAQPVPEKPALPAAPAGAGKEKETPVTAAPVAPEKPAAKAAAKPAAPEKPAAKAAEKPAVQAPAKPAGHAKAEQKTDKAPSAAKAAASGTFSVQVGIFEGEKNASALAEKLKQKGYAASVKQDASDPKKPRYRVLVGSFDTRAKAAVQAKAIMEKEGVKAFVRQN